MATDRPVHPDDGLGGRCGSDIGCIQFLFLDPVRFRFDPAPGGRENISELRSLESDSNRHSFSVNGFRQSDSLQPPQFDAVSPNSKGNYKGDGFVPGGLSGREFHS